MSIAPTVVANQLIEADEGFSLRIGRKPEAVVAEARLCADALMAAVRKNGWAQSYGSKEHLYFEAWAFLAAMYRVTPRVTRTQLIEIGDVTGYEAYAEAFHIPSGIIIGTADSMCLDDEDNWDMRPEYEWADGGNGKRVKKKVGEKAVPLFQLRSMAQTRAMAKALRGPFSWIVAMAGYAPTPKEEMGKSAPAGNGGSHAPKQTPAPSNGAPNASLISEAQRKRLYAISKQVNMPDETLREIVYGFGFERSDEISKDKYEDIVSRVEAWRP